MFRTSLSERIHRLVVSKIPVCVLFTQEDFTTVVGYLYYKDIAIRLCLHGLLGYIGDDTYYCERLINDLRNEEQTELLDFAFNKPVIFEYKFLYIEFISHVRHLSRQGRRLIS